MSFRVIAGACLAVALCAVPATAQQSIKLEFNNGRVSLNAQNAPLRAILAEWARLGGATIVGGERVPGGPVTLELVAVPERQAIDTLLRTVAAYMLAPRRAGTSGASTFDRILILPTSNAPRNPTPPPAASASANGPRPVLPRPPIVSPPVVMPEPGEPGDNDAPPDLVPQPRVVRPPQALPGNGVVVPAPVSEADSPQSEPVVVGGTPPTAGNPFGVPAGSSARPGVIAPVPQQQPQPGPNQRQP